MTVNIGFVMDPIESIKVKKDSSFAMMLEAQARGWTVHYMQQQDLTLKEGIVFGNMTRLQLQDNPEHWFDVTKQVTQPLSDLDVIIMRKDPPFDIEYIYTTYLLELAEAKGTLVFNKPQSLRDANEKLVTAWFPEYCPATMVTRDAKELREFAKLHQEIVLKPLDGMGGKSVFIVKHTDQNLNVVIETLTDSGHRYTMAQKFIPDIYTTGDKRILLIDGEPITHGLARLPKPGESRGNLAVGAKGTDFELTARDREICEAIGPTLRDKGMMFAGIDVIGDYLTEINITSPTCIREIEALSGIKISKKLFDAIEKRLKK